MSSTNPAEFLVDGAGSDASGNRGVDVADGAAVALKLASTTGVDTCTFAVYDAADTASPLASLDAPALTFAGSGTASQVLDPVSGTATLDVASGMTDAHSWKVRCTVTSGGTTYVYERILAFRYNGQRKTVPGEQTEYSQRGWCDEWNRTTSSMVGGAGTYATFAYVQLGTAPYPSTGTLRVGGMLGMYSMPDGVTTYSVIGDQASDGTLLVGDVNRPAIYFGGLLSAVVGVDASSGHTSVVYIQPGSTDYTSKTTPDATTGTVLADMMLAFSGNTPDNALYRIDVEIQGSDGAGNYVILEGELVVKRVSGVVSIIQNFVTPTVDEIGVTGVTFAPNAGNTGITPTVKGKAATTVTWQMEAWVSEGIR